MYRILIVEDDLTIAGALASHLRKWDYEADYVAVSYTHLTLPTILRV